MNEKELSDKLEKECVFYTVLWRRFDKQTGSLMQDDYLDKKYTTLKDAICAISRESKEDTLTRTTWTIIGSKKDGNDFLFCCVWNEEKKILEEI